MTENNKWNRKSSTILFSCFCYCFLSLSFGSVSLSVHSKCWLCRALCLFIWAVVVVIFFLLLQIVCMRLLRCTFNFSHTAFQAYTLTNEKDNKMRKSKFVQQLMVAQVLTHDIMWRASSQTHCFTYNVNISCFCFKTFEREKIEEANALRTHTTIHRSIVFVKKKEEI